MDNEYRVNSFKLGTHDALVNGELHRGIPTRLIFVNNQTERDALPNIDAGTFVAVYGLTNIWQKDGEDSWKTIK